MNGATTVQTSSKVTYTGGKIMGRKRERHKLYFYVDGFPMTVCQLCYDYVYVLTKNHIEKDHGLTKKEYCIIFPEQNGAAFWGNADFCRRKPEEFFELWMKESEAYKLEEEKIAEAEKMKFENPYWSIKERIELLQKWILIHSYIYYELNESLVPDIRFDANCRQLVELAKKNKKDFKESKYSKVFKGFDGSTGFYLFGKLNDSEKENVKIHSYRLIKGFKGEFKLCQKEV